MCGCSTDKLYRINEAASRRCIVSGVKAWDEKSFITACFIAINLSARSCLQGFIYRTRDGEKDADLPRQLL